MNILEFCGFQIIDRDPIFVSPWCDNANLSQIIKNHLELAGANKLQLMIPVDWRHCLQEYQIQISAVLSLAPETIEVSGIVLSAQHAPFSPTTLRIKLFLRCII
ncbi:hypothetical protein M407DRAFT_28477 [Tulasnella calospora MUT 4182]|uniref:Uncharacterized protein n=1 Tax=Tulasnella calospora MUT 4182 TaxID=1051891 RepID=A0A0C3Q191_9AGAM|nr:hypothetical protein M407DRAFT_28477 [Tulasnella calospora MUT 4182]